MLIRAATPADAEAIATVHVASWRSAYRDLLPAEMLANLSILDRADRWRTIVEAGGDVWVGCIDGTVVGFAMVGASRDADAAVGTGELFSIYLDPSQWSRGVGHALHETAVDRLRQAGYQLVASSTCQVLSVPEHAQDLTS